MTTTAKTVWAVLTTDDRTEGRTPNYIKHLCETQVTAIRLAKGQYIQGSDCPISELRVTNIDGLDMIPFCYFKVIGPTREDLGRQAKIDVFRSAQEKAKALGLTDDEIMAIKAGRPAGELP